MFKKLIDILKAHPRKIVFTEGTDLLMRVEEEYSEGV